MSRHSLAEVAKVGAVAGILGFTLTTCICACKDGRVDWPTVQRVVDVACIMQHAALPDARLAEVCRVADDAIPLMHAIAGEHRAGLARAGAARCGDGGAP